MQNFNVVEVNPNEAIGGGGCLCSGGAKNEDCHAPYIVFPATETDNNLSPHAVLSVRCAGEAAKKTPLNGRP